jgi:catalase
MALGNNGGSSPNYFPNSHQDTPQDNVTDKEPPLHLGDVKVARHDHRLGNDDYTQAGDLYRLLPTEEQERLIANIASSLQQAQPEIQQRQLGHFLRADEDYGKRIAEKLGISDEIVSKK